MNKSDAAANMKAMHYETFPPPDDLAGLVRCGWRLTGSAAEPAKPAFPDGSPELIFSFGQPFEHVAADGTAHVQPHAFLVGQITRPMLVRPTGAADLLAVRFEAHSASVLHRPMAAITDRWVAATERFGAPVAALHRELASGNADRRRALLWQALRAMVHQAVPPDARVAAAVATIRLRHGAVALEELAVSLAITPRTLQRLFLRDVGVGPKVLARIVRFQRVFTAWRAGEASLVQVAAECGYSDQSHLARDFRDFAGFTPGGFLTSPPRFTSFFLPLAQDPL